MHGLHLLQGLHDEVGWVHSLAMTGLQGEGTIQDGVLPHRRVEIQYGFLHYLIQYMQLNNVPLMKTLRKEKYNKLLHAFMEIVSKRSFPKGSTLYNTGDKSPYHYILLHGQVLILEHSTSPQYNSEAAEYI
jgi:hypothetical protein